MVFLLSLAGDEDLYGITSRWAGVVLLLLLRRERLVGRRLRATWPGDEVVCDHL
jgi:hypothetical protein